MKHIKISFLIISQVLLLFLYLYKQNFFMQISFNLQKLERMREKLTQHVLSLENEWHLVHNKTTIKQWAEKNHMKPMQLKSIKKAL